MSLLSSSPEAKVDLTPSSLPDEIISKISTEDDLKDSTNTGFRNDFDIIEITDEISGTGNTDSASICFTSVFTTTTTF
jgi:hypothetical protein